MKIEIDSVATLPQDGLQGTLVGRVWLPGDPPGPAVVALREDGVFDISAAAPTVADLCASADPVTLVRSSPGTAIGSLEELLANTSADARSPDKPYFLAPIDLQAIKACGVTFVASLLERVIEEQAGGDISQAESIRRTLRREIGTDLAHVRPGSEEAVRLKAVLTARGLWSQYLEVGIGPDAEVFSKSQPMSAVGTGAEIGIHPDSNWSNPEPELVLVVSPAGEVVGAMLGNDVNLRDFEGRSALLLGRSKDNNASCAVGPFLRLFDGSFDIDTVRRCHIELEVNGDDGYELTGSSSMSAISRDVLDLVAQTINRHHQYPDGLVLFTGTLFAPAEDRDAPGMGFTHKLGDRVRIRAPELGALVNRVVTTDRASPWTFGISQLMHNLAARGLL